MKRIELIDLYKKIETLPSKNYNKFLLWAIMKTKSVFKSEIDKVADKERELYTDENYVKFEQRRISIVESFSEKNEDGTFKIENNQYVISTVAEIQSELQTKLAELRAEYSETLATREKMFEEYREYINADVDVEIVTTSFENLPSDMTPEEYEFLSKFVKED